METNTPLGELSKVLTADEARKITGHLWLSRREAAQYLGIGVQTLANHKHDGPKMHKFFGSVRYSVADLDSWAQQQHV